MIEARFFRCLHAVLLCLLLGLSGAAFAQDRSPAEAAFEQAIADFEAGNVDRAIARLEPLRSSADTPGPVLSLLGILYLESGQPAEALNLLEPLASRKEADAAVLYHAGRAARVLGETAKAEYYLERSVALLPRSPAGRELGLLRTRQGRIGEAFQLLYPWVELNPTDGEARLAATQAAIRLGRLSEASRLLFPMDPNAQATRLLQAELAQLKGDPAGALKALEPLLQGSGELSRDAVGMAADAHLMRDDPLAAERLLENRVGRDLQLSLLLARAQRQLGKLDAAIQTLQPLAEPLLAPSEGKGQSALAGAVVLEYGRALVKAGRSAQGEKALRRAVELNPRSRLAWENLAEALTAQGKTSEAREAGDRSQRLARMDQQPVAPPAGARQAGSGTPAGAVNTQLANLQPIMEALVAGEPERGLALARAEATRVPQDPRPRLLEVRILLSMNQGEDGLRAADRLLELFAPSPDAHYLRGVAHLSLGDTEAAEVDLRKALELSPDHTPTLNDLAVLLMTQQRHAEARTMLERVLVINPNDQLARQNLESLPPSGS